jgi:large subunit ribosomal protein L35
MGKMKSKRALMKRIKITKSGKLLRKSAYTGHLAPRKTTKQKRQLRKLRQMHPSDVKRVRGLISR